METLYLGCVVHGLEVHACAPTGIAAARINVPRTPVHSYTLHYLLGLNVGLETTLDATSLKDEKTARLAKTKVLFTYEASMIDDVTWSCVKDQLTSVGAVAGAAEGGETWPAGDAFGRVHHIICMDLKQLPPATSRPPFLAGDHSVFENSQLRVLEQQKRLS